MTCSTSKNRIFTGTKWAAAGAAVVEPFFERSCALFGDVPRTRFEPVTVTKYAAGQYQANPSWPQEVQPRKRAGRKLELKYSDPTTEGIRSDDNTSIGETEISYISEDKETQKPPEGEAKIKEQ